MYKEVDVSNKKHARIRIWAFACEWPQPPGPHFYFWVLFFLILLWHRSFRSVHCWAGSNSQDLNPCGWDSNQAKTHNTWFQDLIKLRFLMYHCRKNSVRDKMIGKKWIYSDSERNTLHRQSGGHCRGQVQPWNVVWLVFIGWIISYANEWEDYSNYFWEGVEISRIWATAHSLVF